ncbi:PD-(D/E)XK nuclease family protein [Clostridium botulinum C]|uniref:PD-(D/E)XK nuclease family protein n=1 Tax=Clostridium botulinum TaxID=1491 RepID=UPI001E604FE3|nr:PD-(D/E)XK nuclease family protein [Clostridium botulinum]MCD3245386.1 PD-(D/E)XK nuclease family protein [Clostridium botulinum C]MCD3261765.1 PD-(D/E)XK nuclease family protein [Clostridium botulinum C]
MRKTKEQLNQIKEKYGVDELWSWSKYHSYKTDPYGWYLKYLKHEKETKQSIYGVEGGVCHDIIEQFYLGEIKYEQMIEEYENKLFEINLSGLKYNRKDKKANEKIANKYEECVRLFYKEHIPIKHKAITEQFILIKVGKHIFQGYIDFIHKDENNNYIITDWKTSTIYQGKKIDKEKGQLVLYAEGLIQKGVPINKIKIRWDFLKYCKLTYTLAGIDKETKQHKTSTKNVLRNEWVKSIESNLKMWLKKIKQYDELQIEDMVATAIENNNLDNMLEDIQQKYKREDCYVYIPLTKDSIDELKEDIIDTINEIKLNKKAYDCTEDDRIWWTTIDKSNEFYFANLCGYSAKQHKPYKEYLDDLNLFVKDRENNEEETDDSWLNELD